jgi:hypothetical protein
MKDHVISSHLVPFIFKPRREDLARINPWEKDMIAFPKIQIEQLFIWNLFQSTCRGIDQLTCKVSRSKDKDIPVTSSEIWKREQAAQFWVLNGKSRLLKHFTDDTFLRRFPCLKWVVYSYSRLIISILPHGHE